MLKTSMRFAGALILASGLVFVSACQKSEASSKKTEAKSGGTADCQSSCETPCMGADASIMEGATLHAAMSADAVFQCPMHAEVISHDPDQNCPLCKMDLKKMSAQAVTELREGDLFGCPMCPVVREAGDKDEGCSVCGMKLMPIEAKSTSGSES